MKVSQILNGLIGSTHLVIAFSQNVILVSQLVNQPITCF